MTNERIAGFSKHVIAAARNGDTISRRILTQAGRELGLAASAVIRRLGMERQRFPVAYVGGVFVARELVLDSLREEIMRVAPQAFVAPPLYSPALAAARMAREHFNQLALAV